MHGIELGIILIGGILVGVSGAAKRGHRMPVAACIMAMIVGGMLVATPTVFSFLLQLTGHEGRMSEDERMPCWILGGILALVGMTASFFSKPPSDASPKTK